MKPPLLDKGKSVTVRGNEAAAKIRRVDANLAAYSASVTPMRNMPGMKYAARGMIRSSSLL